MGGGTEEETNAGLFAHFSPGTATALALNAAQVWNYLTTYSTTANKLPDGEMADLNELLQHASSRFREAIGQKDSFDSLAYRESCGLFKYFLSQAIDLGKQVWTRFDTVGMGIGIILMICSLVLSTPETLKDLLYSCIFRRIRRFSSSKIECILWRCSIIIQSKRRNNENMISNLSYFKPLLIAVCSRLHQFFVMGHGQDPSIRKHWAHESYVFITSLIMLSLMRIHYASARSFHLQQSMMHTVMDITTLFLLGYSWIEKRSLDTSRHGYLTSRSALILCTAGFFMLSFQWCKNKSFVRAGHHLALWHGTIHLVVWRSLAMMM